MKSRRSAAFHDVLGDRKGSLQRRVSEDHADPANHKLRRTERLQEREPVVDLVNAAFNGWIGVDPHRLRRSASNGGQQHRYGPSHETNSMGTNSSAITCEMTGRISGAASPTRAAK